MDKRNGQDSAADRLAEAWRRHERCWRDHRFVYAVVSRRSRGVSIGINLSPVVLKDKACNFACVYCQVRRDIPSAAPRPAITKIDLRRIGEELDCILQAEKDGSLYEEAPFDALLPEERGVRDIAFSGDGEPTACPRFAEAVRLAVAARRRYGLEAAKLVVITNAAFLDKRAVRAALALLAENNGEIWAKLDAGTEAYFQQINRAHISLDRIVENITQAAIDRPLVIQSLWLRLRGEAPSQAEIAAFGARLNTILAGGGHIRAVHLHTIVRDPAENYVAPLPPDELARIAACLRRLLPTFIPIEVY